MTNLKTFRLTVRAAQIHNRHPLFWRLAVRERRLICYTHDQIIDWPHEDTEVPGETANTHLWEESWDDDDTSEDFSKQLK